jgi:hypothetical protein
MLTAVTDFMQRAHKISYWPPTSVKVKEEWTYTSTSSSIHGTQMNSTRNDPDAVSIFLLRCPWYDAIPTLVMLLERGTNRSEMFCFTKKQNEGQSSTEYS